MRRLTAFFVCVVSAVVAMRPSAGVAAAAAQLIEQRQAEVLVTAAVGCQLDPAEGVYDYVISFTERIKNQTASIEIFMDDARFGAIVWHDPRDVSIERPWLRFVTDYEPRLEKAAATFAVAPGAYADHAGAVVLTVRRGSAPESTWPLGPGRHLIQVRSLRLRHATKEEALEHETPFTWVDVRSQQIWVDLPDGDGLPACPVARRSE